MDNILAKWQGEFKAVYGRGPKKEDYSIAPAPVKKLYDDKLGNNRIKRQVKRKHIDEEQRVVNLPECYNIRQDTSEPSIKRPKQDVKDDFKLEDIKENNVLSEHSSPDRRWGLPLNSKTLLMRTPVMSRVREDTAEAPPTPSPNKKFTSRKQGRNLTKLYANINLMLDSPKKAPESDGDANLTISDGQKNETEYDGQEDGGVGVGDEFGNECNDVAPTSSSEGLTLKEKQDLHRLELTAAAAPKNKTINKKSKANTNFVKLNMRKKSFVKTSSARSKFQKFRNNKKGGGGWRKKAN